MALALQQIIGAASNFSAPMIDPSTDDHDLVDYLCGPSDGFSCPLLRNCTYDPVLQFDPDFNSTCDGPCMVCLHKTLWPLDPFDYLTFCVLFVCGILAGASGIGGGGLIMPLLMLVGNFLVDEAVPLSHMAVLGNGIAQNLINVPRKHPHSNLRGLIDLNVPLVLLPAMLGGNSVGVLIGPMLPASGVEVLACFLLLFASGKTFRTALKAFAKESKTAAAAHPPRGLLTGMTAHMLVHETPGESPHISPARPPADALPSAGAGFEAAPQTSTATNKQLSQELLGSPDQPNLADGSPSCSGQTTQAAAAESCCMGVPAPHVKVGALCVLWSALVFIFIGSHILAGKTSGPCDPERVAWLMAELAVIIAAVVTASAWLRVDQRRRDDALALVATLAPSASPPADGASAPTPEGVPVSLPGDVRWTGTNVVVLPIVGVGVGVVAGLLGLGGGELMAPTLLAVGMLPQVASATSACMVLFTSSSDVAHYLAQGTFTADPGYALVCMVIGFLAAFIGRFLALKIVKDLSHPSIIAFILAGVLAVALALVGVQMSRHGLEWDFSSLCDS